MIDLTSSGKYFMQSQINNLCKMINTLGEKNDPQSKHHTDYKNNRMTKLKERELNGVNSNHEND